jgi:hypothetical protein
VLAVLIGGEIADTRFRIRRRIRADHPADPIRYLASTVILVPALPSARRHE